MLTFFGAPWSSIRQMITPPCAGVVCESLIYEWKYAALVTLQHWQHHSGGFTQTTGQTNSPSLDLQVISDP